MHLFTEAALYWETLVQVAETTGLNEADYLSVYNLLAAYEMGEHHLAAKKRRRRGDLLRADAYLSKVLASNSEVSGQLLYSLLSFPAPAAQHSLVLTRSCSRC